jgi:hypothetical protein
VCKSSLTFTLVLKNSKQTLAHQEEHRSSHNSIAITIDSIRLGDLINIFSYPLQKESKEKPLLVFNIIRNDIGRRCTCNHPQKIGEILRKGERMIIEKPK